MLRISRRRILNDLKWLSLEILPIIFTFTSIKDSEMGIEDLLKEYKFQVFYNLQSRINRNFCMLVEKGCNNGIFDHLLENKTVAVLNNNPIFGISIDESLTEKYIKKEKMPKKYKYVLFSPYLHTENLDEKDHFYYKHAVYDYFDDKIRSLFLKIFKALKDSNVSTMKNEIIDFSREKTPQYTYYRYSLDGVGCMHQTYFKQRNDVMDSLIEISDEIKNWRRLKSYDLINNTTKRLLKMLEDMGILIKKVDFEEYPDIIPLIFPYVMLEMKYYQRGNTQLMNIGVDLTKVKGSEFEEYFNLEKHNLKYFLAFEIHVA